MHFIESRNFWISCLKKDVRSNELQLRDVWFSFFQYLRFIWNWHLNREQIAWIARHLNRLSFLRKESFFRNMWNIVENYLENYGDALGRASKIGKYWISMFTILRFMFLLSIAEPAWGGHGLECNTDTPGCARLCENKFWPLNPTSLWEMQLLAMIIPIGYFVMYSNWRVDKVKLAIQKKDDDYKNHPKWFFFYH